MPRMTPNPLAVTEFADRPRDAFARVVNLRTVAALFYLCLVVVLSSHLIWVLKDDASQWWFDAAYVLRQTLISGACAWLSIGIGAAVLARRAQTRALSVRAAVVVLGGASVLGAVTGVVLRIVASGRSWAGLGESIAYLASVCVLWAMIAGVVAAMYWMRRAAMISQARMAAVRADRARLEAQMDEAQLAALQAQIEPHFLFNTLANVKRLYDTDPGAARTMLSSLITYLQAALPAMRASGSTVERELELVRSYLTIIGMRMGDRLRFRIELADEVRCASLPTMVVSTLVENAVKHGLSTLPEGGEIVVEAHAEAGCLRVVVADDEIGRAHV